MKLNPFYCFCYTILNKNKYSTLKYKSKSEEYITMSQNKGAGVKNINSILLSAFAHHKAQHNQWARSTSAVNGVTKALE